MFFLDFWVASLSLRMEGNVKDKIESKTTIRVQRSDGGYQFRSVLNQKNIKFHMLIRKSVQNRVGGEDNRDLALGDLPVGLIHAKQKE